MTRSPAGSVASRRTPDSRSSAPCTRVSIARIAAGPRSQGPQLFPLTDDDGALRGPFNAFLLAPALGDPEQLQG